MLAPQEQTKRPMRLAAAVLLLFSAVLAHAGAKTPKIVFLAGEYEYHSKESLPPFARELSARFKADTVVLERPEDPKQQTIPGLEALADADLLVVFVRRMTLPEDELARIKAYVASGRPVIGLRTASHAFENWKDFDREVWGGNYAGHHGNKLKTTVSVAGGAERHPILKGVAGFVSDGSLYRNTPLRPHATVLLRGKVEGQPEEPVAWTHDLEGRKIIYTSLGHPNDFKEESFQKLLHNAIGWALGKPLEKR